MKYITILGRQPELGLVELESLYGEKVSAFGKHSAIVTKSPDINKLGGAQKIGRILYEGPARDINETPINLDELPIKDGKTVFGLSYYGLQATARFVNVSGITMKKRLKSKGSLRFVSPQTGTHLSAAQVKFNGLLRKGFEVLVVVNKQKMVIAITEQIQDIDWYASRDYHRPSRSAKVGMLPPKLAQIMVNTTSAKTVVDPFCGTGVVLQESLLLGRRAYGSDASEEMVQSTTANLEWLTKQRGDLPRWEASLSDARAISFPKEKLAIVSEGYLGPNMSKKPTAKDLAPIKKELTRLYSEALTHWHTQLPANSEVTITVPSWHSATGWQTLGLVDRIPDLGYDFKSFSHGDVRKLIYRRPNQIVGRQLLILRSV